MEYIERGKNNDCIFCACNRENRDRENLVILRTELTFVMMNRFPYSHSHVMIAPIRHIKYIQEMSQKEQLDIMELMAKTITTIENVYHPDGFNVGLNLGKVAGAGFEDHLHFHIVPRWDGDMNFMPVIADTKIMSEHLQKTYDRLVSSFRKLAEEG
jgi:ATP adenylyltransferase